MDERSMDRWESFRQARLQPRARSQRELIYVPKKIVEFISDSFG